VWSRRLAPAPHITKLVYAAKPREHPAREKTLRSNTLNVLTQETKSIYCVRKIKKSTCCAKSLAKDVFSEYTVLGRPKKYTGYSELSRHHTGVAQLAGLFDFFKRSTRVSGTQSPEGDGLAFVSPT